MATAYIFFLPMGMLVIPAAGVEASFLNSRFRLVRRDSEVLNPDLLYLIFEEDYSLEDVSIL